LLSGLSFSDLVAGGVDGGDSMSCFVPATTFDAPSGADGSEGSVLTIGDANRQVGSVSVCRMAAFKIFGPPLEVCKACAR
jgi:hypothetical protein